MNSRQRLVLGIGLTAFLGLALFPPCESVGDRSVRPDGHHFIFSLPDSESADFPAELGGPIVINYRVDYARLGLMLGVVIVATGAGILLVKGGRREPRS